MPQEFNLDEIFTIAVDIEKNGEQFYRKAAELTKDKDSKKLLTELADWEKGKFGKKEREALGDDADFLSEPAARLRRVLRHLRPLLEKHREQDPAARVVS